jgi:hypothetical protein
MLMPYVTTLVAHITVTVKKDSKAMVSSVEVWVSDYENYYYIPPDIRAQTLNP